MAEVPRRRRKRVDAPKEQPRRAPDPREQERDELDELIEREERSLKELGEEQEQPPRRRPPDEDHFGEEFDDYGIPAGEGAGAGKSGGRFKMPQGPLGQVLTMLLVAILVAAVMMMYFGGYLGVATKNDIASIADERIVNAVNPVKASVASLSSTALDLDDLLAYGYVTSSALSGLAKSSDLTGYVKSSTLTSRLDGLATDADLKIVRDEMDALEGLDEDIQLWVDAVLDDMRDEVNAILATANNTDTQAQIGTLAALIAALQAEVDALEFTGSGWLTYGLVGSAGHYTLTVESATGGTFVGLASLVWNAPHQLAGDTYDEAMSDFYGRLTPTGRTFIPEIAAGNLNWNPELGQYVVEYWVLKAVSFVTSANVLTAGEEFSAPMTILGLNDFPDYTTYVSVLPASKYSSEDVPGEW